MGLPFDPKEVVGYECRHASYTTNPDRTSDVITAKMYAHLKNGERVPFTHIEQDYERSFWVTKKAQRTHRDKLEWEKLERLDEFKTTQVALVERVARATGQYYSRQTSLRTLSDFPYIYGADVPTTVLFRESIRSKYPNHIHPTAMVAALDIETSVTSDYGEIIICGLTFKDRAIIAINEEWLDDKGGFREKAIQEKFELYLGKFKKERNIKLEIVFCVNEGECAAKCLEKAHEWKPDFITIWNMNFDIPKIIRALTNCGYNLADVFSDPKVPPEFRKFRYKEGNSKKVTQAGKVTGLHPADRWHEVICPASFYFLDSMCLYKRIRLAEGMVSSYSLDAALNRHLDLGKLRIEACDHLSGLPWHREMQTNFKEEYCIYNLFDDIGLELLDEKTGDIIRAFPALCGVSDFNKFNSNPRRIVDDLHFFCLERGQVIATTAENIRHEYDKYVVDLKGWIVTLPSYMMYDNGQPLVEELPGVRSMGRAHCADIDIEGTYPNVEDVMNISNETTYRELHAIQGIPDQKRRQIGINLTGGVVNAIELCHELFEFPTLVNLDKIYGEHRYRYDDHGNEIIPLSQHQNRAQAA